MLQQSSAANVSTATRPGKKEIEDIYQKKTQLEHILLRPDTYIGSTEKQQQKLWVHDGVQLKLEEISYVPGLYKIFDEILVNAADNKVRDPKMDTIKVDIDKVSVSGFCKMQLQTIALQNESPVRYCSQQQSSFFGRRRLFGLR